MQFKALRMTAIAAAFCAGAFVTGANATPELGGTPIHTESDSFTDGALWGMTVYSYVYNSDTDLPNGYMLDPGEMLFMYFLDGDDDKTVSVDFFSVGNPEGMPITAIGYETNITPPDYDGLKRQDPYHFGYHSGSQASSWSYFGNPQDPFSTLEPDEWSLVWYIAEAEDWTLGPATGSGAGIGNTQYVPVPTIPTPGTLALLAMAGVLGLRRRLR